MAKREKLHLGGGMSIETVPDLNGRYFVAYRKGCSMFFRDTKVMRKWLALPLKTASRDALDSWLASLEAADAQRKGGTVEPVGDANAPGSFDPLAHEEDPTANTRTII